MSDEVLFAGGNVATPVRPVAAKGGIPRYVWVVLGASVLGFFAMGAFVIALLLSGDASTRPSDSDLTTVATTHIRTYPKAVRATKARVHSHKIKTIEDVVADLANHAKPLADALGAALNSHADEQGNITDSRGVEEVLEELALGVEKK